MENTKETIHVRAKRGQATDSHSIAERIRRQKINQKFKCLQELVPGCNKSQWEWQYVGGDNQLWQYDEGDNQLCVITAESG